MPPREHSVSRLSLPVADAAPAVPRFVTTCEGCGVCCREQILPPFLDEIDFIPEALQREVIEARKREAHLLALGNPCIWFDEQTRKCIHHADRPNVCREFVIGEEDCLEIRARWLVNPT